MSGSPRQGPLDPLSGVDPDQHPLSIRSLYVLLVVVLSAWVLGAALPLSAELASGYVLNQQGVLDREMREHITKLREQKALPLSYKAFH